MLTEMKKTQDVFFFGTQSWMVFEDHVPEQFSANDYLKLIVLTNEKSALSLCEGSDTDEKYNIRKFYSNINSRWAFGLLCGNDAVVLGNGITGMYKQDEYIKFISLHEAFHYIYQYKLGKLPTNLMLSKRPKIKDIDSNNQENLGKYLEALVNNESCYEINNRFEKLDNIAAVYLDFLSYFEWPAEYFAFKSVFQNDFNLYLQFIDSAEYDMNYKYGVMVGSILDANNNPNWRVRVNNGENMINIFLEGKNCQNAFQYSSFVKAKKVNIFSN